MRTCVHGLAAVFVVVLFLTSACFAAPVSPDQAKQAVQGWLVLDQKPMGMDMQGSSAQSVAAHAVSDGDAAYYIVALSGGGFVAVAGDDLVEPIVGFQNDGSFDADPNNPLFALLEQDMRGRQAKARSMTGMDMSASAENGANKRWATLLNAAAMAAQGVDLSVEMGEATISDVRVASLVDSRWGQSTVGGENTYNIYTPNNYVCGCVATAMSQLMRYHRFPVEGVGNNTIFSIKVDGEYQHNWRFRGGDGSGGPYVWDDMPLVPDASTPLAQRQAISGLTLDVGLAVSMDYGNDGSGTNTLYAASMLPYFFGYANAIPGFNSGNNLEASARNTMVNPNLDADLPVLLGITGTAGGHAIVCDGYGYDSSTMYHHLNMGWSGSDDVWYNLPAIDCDPAFTSVYKCVFNVFTDKTGEIISGRVLDADGNPVSGSLVVATSSTDGSKVTDVTNEKGVFGLVGVASSTEYTVKPYHSGLSFVAQTVTTGDSGDSESYTSSSGNVWGIDFTPVTAVDAAGAARNLLLLQ
ncbi:C10 family peptidase [Pseudodesulfovibrio senegalensis]|uniref:Peptidase C10 n=1 Tax=Pseudodesulfovibrio senegalensis TaxID=1721087 RepID=A0A6N6N1W7_9BACT|nr:C10 family peptidase [Pseudodesulfovibrio senegalensis]KAB1439089.1 peptidase C10 [Pseudodesulfovibrio senegalensis]